MGTSGVTSGEAGGKLSGRFCRDLFSAVMIIWASHGHMMFMRV